MTKASLVLCGLGLGSKVDLYLVLLAVGDPLEAKPSFRQQSIFLIKILFIALQ
jgi:hypothetical protein